MASTSTPIYKRNPYAESARDAIVERIRWCVENGLLELPEAVKPQRKATGRGRKPRQARAASVSQ